MMEFTGLVVHLHWGFLCIDWWVQYQWRKHEHLQ